MPLDRHAGRLLDFLATSSIERPETLSAQDRRGTLRALSESVETAPETVRGIDNRSIPADTGEMRVRIYDGGAEHTAPSSGLVYFHGGGWVAGGLDTHDGVCRRLANAAMCQVVAVDYRLAPEHPFPAGLEDCLTAYRWAASNCETLGLDPSRLAIGGDSTGAGMAAAVCAMLRDEGGPQPALQVLICPVLDALRADGSRHSFGSGYFADQAVIQRDLRDYCPADTDPRDPRISPLLADDFKNLPAAIVHTAEYDPFRDEGAAYAGALRLAGVAVREAQHAGMIHYFYAMARAIPHANVAAIGIGSDIRDMLGDGG